MFTASLQNSIQRKSQKQPTKPDQVIQYMGVDLSRNQCYQLKPGPLFSAYDSTTLHYVIDAVQKGLKPPTKRGLKRLKKKNYQKRQQLKLKKASNQVSAQPAYIQPLNPNSPQQICMKALRRQFRQQIEPSPDIKSLQSDDGRSSSVLKIIQKEKPVQTKQERHALSKPKFIRKKQNQLRRRIELITLVKENYHVLLKIFGRQKLQGYNKKTLCPKISRQEVKAALTKHYEQLIQKNQEKIRVINDPEEMKKLVDKKTEERELRKNMLRQRPQYGRTYAYSDQGSSSNGEKSEESQSSELSSSSDEGSDESA